MRIGIAFVSVCLVTAAGMTQAAVSAASAPEEICTPRPDPLACDIAVDPPQPRVGEEVHVTVGVGEVDGLLFGNPVVSLQGAAPSSVAIPCPSAIAAWDFRR
jgi:hypothetical protein